MGGGHAQSARAPSARARAAAREAGADVDGRHRRAAPARRYARAVAAANRACAHGRAPHENATLSLLAARANRGPYAPHRTSARRFPTPACRAAAHEHRGARQIGARRPASDGRRMAQPLPCHVMSRTIIRHPRRRTDSSAAQRAPAGRTNRAAGEAAACNAKPPRATSNKKAARKPLFLVCRRPRHHAPARPRITRTPSARRSRTPSAPSSDRRT
ncbi:hypothetical protein DM47_1524 [Burkholderia mallei]|nr:hypothetical protein DM46_1128 [Burkholderia mallei]KOS89785.1 hypothetical protein DM53_3924 [Burkholderia mallei]KOT00169.1 hypothetical protein DM50_2669 [Burkholderia mallei]KOT06800.1 hypothetical protein DM77_1796 [Burkholderia mallei]KOT17906.1 hypothetical protein DM47_1524 [Burkholderia mallei]